MRTPVCVSACLLAVLVAVAPASADSYVELAGGFTTPLGDDDWDNAVESSPKIALRIGSFPKELGGFVSADWTPYNTDSDSAFGVDVSAHRFRLLGGVMFHHLVSNTLVVTGRGGIGADIAYAKATVNFGPIMGENSDTDVALGFEVGVGLWFKTGGMELGAELALPFSIHDHEGGNDGIDYQYTSYDLDVLFGVRFLSH
jgi:hypothetical protein